MKKKSNAAKLFIWGHALILVSPFFSSLIMRTIYMNEANFLEQRFAYFQQAFQLSGALLVLAGLTVYVCNVLQTRKDEHDEKN